MTTINPQRIKASFDQLKMNSHPAGSTSSITHRLLFFTTALVALVFATSTSSVAAAVPVSKSTDEENLNYQVQVRTTQNCTLDSSNATKSIMSGTIYARVQDSQGKPVPSTDLGFLLVGKKKDYSGSATTNRWGRASFTFRIAPMDEGVSLWCSIAVDNPNMPFDQQVPCSMTVDCHP